MSKCCFCEKEIEYKVNGNDPRPIRVKGEEMSICCNECNARIVVPTRVTVWGMEKDLKEKLAEKDEELAYMTKQAKKFNNEAQKYFEDAYCNDTIYQDKINFAVELLEQVRQEIAVKDKIGLRLFIDGKIKEIKEKV